MKSFFSQIKNYFSASYAGRYEEILLQEVSKECPTLMKILFDDYDPKFHSIDLEYSYIDNRRADLAILNDQKEPVFLLEIKCEDSPLEGQLESYIKFVKRKKVKFLCLTRHELTKLEENMLNSSGSNIQHMLFSDLYAKISNNSTIQNNPIGKIYAQYLKENGNMFVKISKSGLEKFLKRIFLPWKGSGRVRKTSDMVETIPTTFKDLMNNMYFLNDKIGKKIDCQITIDFSVFPRIGKLSKEKNGKDSYLVKSNDKAGGELYVYASGSFSKKNPHVVVEYGMYFDVLKKRKQKFVYYYYCRIYVNDFCHINKEQASLTELSNFKDSEQKIMNLIKAALCECLEEEKMKHVKREFRATLKNF